jgi:hypothetical protein
MVLRRLFGPKREEVMGEMEKITIHTLHLVSLEQWFSTFFANFNPIFTVP